ncbi:LTA synthase family protein [Peribacillus kribbensis]|uniref:LTA synthase family protein n=1 Tax=Peribacillus kribbensis TaxID=356658 RepID=UPI00068730D1|nr:LTA synthase family protein [Peribacillus kribbensis]
MQRKISAFGLFLLFSLILKSLYVKFSILDRAYLTGILAETALLSAAILGLCILNRRLSVISLLLFNVLYSFYCLAALLFYDFYNAIFTYKSFAELDQAGTVKDGIFALFDLRYLLLFSDFLFLFLFPIYKKFLDRFSFRTSKKSVTILLSACLLFILLGLKQSASSVSELNKYNSLGLAGYQLMEAGIDIAGAGMGHTHIDAEMVKRQRPVTGAAARQWNGAAKNKNLIIIQLESIQNFLLHSKLQGKEITPNLNQFMKESLYFPHVYTQVGKGNTSDAEFLINTSIYPLGDVPMSKAVEGKSIPSLPRLLEKEGYQTATFHTNSVSFWNRDKLYASLGFDTFYDKDFFGAEDSISYGASDEVLYTKTAEKLGEVAGKKEKFYAHVISLSSHFPYLLPESKLDKTPELPRKFKGSPVGSYIQAAGYADYSFGLFVNALKKEGLWDSSVIAVYGDHQGLQSKGKKDTELVRSLLGRAYDSTLDHLNVPLMIKVPGIHGKSMPMAGGLIDVYPTLANLLGLPIEKEPVFGTDLINAKTNLAGIRFYAPTGTFVDQEYAFKPGKTNYEGTMTSLTNRKTGKADAKRLDEMNQILNYMKLSDSYIHSVR